jgi:hypothetical protein
MSIDELRRALDEAWNSETDHAERLLRTAAILQTALREAGMVPTLVGGAAIEFHAPGAYTTTDIDLVVERRTRAAIHEVFTAMGFEKPTRHWVRGDLLVEVPGNYMGEPTDEVSIDQFTLRVVRKEVVLADRIVGFREWKHTAYAVQAMDLIRAFGDRLDEAPLRAHLRREGADQYYEPLRRLALSGRPVTHKELERLWKRYYLVPRSDGGDR